MPRVDHLGLVLDEDEFDATLERAERLNLRIQEHAGRRTFVETNAGYRLEIHPPREWTGRAFPGAAIQNPCRIPPVPKWATFSPLKK